MLSECGGYALSYNGELYNAVELRRLLEHEGAVFHSRCDTEVVLRVAKPFEWKYTRDDLAALLARLTAIPTGLKIPACEYVTELPNKTTQLLISRTWPEPLSILTRPCPSPIRPRR